MFQKKSHYIFSDYTPTIDALLSVTMLSIIAIAVLSVPSPDSYMQDVRVNILTVQARQIAVPTTITLWPDLGVNYEIGKSESTSISRYRNNFENTVQDETMSFLTDTIEMNALTAQQYQIFLTMEGRRDPDSSLATCNGNYGMTWINHPTCNPEEPLSYIIIKH